MRLTLAFMAALLAAPATAEPYGTADALVDLLSGEADIMAERSRRADHAQASLAANLDRVRRQPVRDRMAQACATLFVRQPDETITNPLCYEAFLREGLPSLP